MTLHIDNPINPGNLVENALRTLAVDAHAAGLWRVTVCTPGGEYLTVETDDPPAAFAAILESLVAPPETEH